MALLTSEQEAQLLALKKQIDDIKVLITQLQADYDAMKNGIAVTMTVLPNGSFTINDSGSAITDLMEIVNQLKQVPQEQLRLKEREINTKNGEINIIKNTIIQIVYGALGL